MGHVWFSLHFCLRLSFIAFGQFGKIQQALNVSSQATPHELEAAAREVRSNVFLTLGIAHRKTSIQIVDVPNWCTQVCSTSKAQLRLQKRQGAYNPYDKRAVLKLCWKALWAHTLIQWGYGFNENSTTILFARSVGKNDEPVNWATGSMIFEVNTFPWKSPVGYVWAYCRALSRFHFLSWICFCVRKFQVPFLWAALTALLFVIVTTLMAVQVSCENDDQYTAAEFGYHFVGNSRVRMRYTRAICNYMASNFLFYFVISHMHLQWIATAWLSAMIQQAVIS